MSFGGVYRALDGSASSLTEELGLGSPDESLPRPASRRRRTSAGSRSRVELRPACNQSLSARRNANQVWVRPSHADRGRTILLK